MRLIYNYSNESILTTESEMEFDPIEGLPLIPAFATDVKPNKAKTGFDQVFKDDSWSYVPVKREIPTKPFEPYYIWNEVNWSWDIDETAKKAYETNRRISELRQLLAQSDFKVLPNYDGDNTAIKAQRYDWRNELRSLFERVQ